MSYDDGNINHKIIVYYTIVEFYTYEFMLVFFVPHILLRNNNYASTRDTSIPEKKI